MAAKIFKCSKRTEIRISDDDGDDDDEREKKGEGEIVKW